jgi:hypothetical protein
MLAGFVSIFIIHLHRHFSSSFLHNSTARKFPVALISRYKYHATTVLKWEKVWGAVILGYELELFEYFP